MAASAGKQNVVLVVVAGACGSCKGAGRDVGYLRAHASLPVCLPARVCFAARVLSGVYLCGSRMVVWVAAASPLTVSSPRVMVRPWCAVRPL